MSTLNTRIHRMPIVLGALFTIAVAVAATIGYVTAVSAQDGFRPAPPKVPPAVLTDRDIGFQQSREGSRVGTLMIRIDGKWVPAVFENRTVEEWDARPVTK